MDIETMINMLVTCNNTIDMVAAKLKLSYISDKINEPLCPKHFREQKDNVTTAIVKGGVKTIGKFIVEKILRNRVYVYIKKDQKYFVYRNTRNVLISDKNGKKIFNMIVKYLGDTMKEYILLLLGKITEDLSTDKDITEDYENISDILEGIEMEGKKYDTKFATQLLHIIYTELSTGLPFNTLHTNFESSL